MAMVYRNLRNLTTAGLGWLAVTERGPCTKSSYRVIAWGVADMQDDIDTTDRPDAVPVGVINTRDYGLVVAEGLESFEYYVFEDD